MRLFALLTVIMLLLAAGCAPAEETPEPEPWVMEVELYFGDLEAIQEAEPGEYGYVTPVLREIPHTEDILQLTLEELIKGPKEEEKDRVTWTVPADLNILDISIENEIATIDFCENMFKGEDRVAGTLGGQIFIQSILWTATQFPDVAKVQVLVEGEYWDDGHMIWDEPKSPA